MGLEEKREIMFLENKIIAHRGGFFDNQKIYENTQEVFQTALQKGFAIELDVRVTKDNQVVVYHDDNLKRLMNEDAVIEDLRLDELPNEPFSIPLFRDILKQIDGKVPLLIEIKSMHQIGHSIDTIMEELKDYTGEYAIQSFHPYVLLYLKWHYKDVIRGQLGSPNRQKDIPKIQKWITKTMCFNKLTKPTFISYEYNEISFKKIAKLKKKYVMICFTIREQDDYTKCKDIYDAWICENMQNWKEG